MSSPVVETVSSGAKKDLKHGTRALYGLAQFAQRSGDHGRMQETTVLTKDDILNAMF